MATVPKAKRALPALKPDRITVWPVDDDHFGVDVLYRGRGAYLRAREVDRELAAAGMATTFRQELDGAWGVRLAALDRPAMLTLLEDVVGGAPRASRPRRRGRAR